MKKEKLIKKLKNLERFSMPPRADCKNDDGIYLRAKDVEKLCNKAQPQRSAEPCKELTVADRAKLLRIAMAHHPYYLSCYSHHSPPQEKDEEIRTEYAVGQKFRYLKDDKPIWLVVVEEKSCQYCFFQGGTGCTLNPRKQYCTYGGQPFNLSPRTEIHNL